MFFVVFNGLSDGNGQLILRGGWYTYPSEQYEFVSWNDEIPNI